MGLKKTQFEYDNRYYIFMIEVDESQIELTIADNEPGLPAAFNLEEVDSLGINLINGLSKQMRATCDIEGRIRFSQPDKKTIL